MKLTPHLRFNNGKCREAIEFYKSCFGEPELFIQTVGESPMAKDMPTESHSKIMHASFEINGLVFTASDMMRDKAIVGDCVSLMINCDSEEQLRAIFDKLAEGGEIFMKPEEAFWGAIFGVVIDRYGFEWSLNFPIEK